MRTIVAALVLMVSALTLSAQQAVEVVASIPIQQRQGVFQAPSYVVPVNAVGMVFVRAEMDAATYENVSNRLTLRIYTLNVADGVWRWRSESTWEGGRQVTWEGVINPPFTVGTSLDGLRGQTIRAEIEIPTRMRVGATVLTVAPE